MKKTIFLCASILICFIPNTYVFSSSDEIEMREFQDGVLIYKLSEFKEEEWPKELKDKLLACGDCPGIDGYLPDYYTKSIELRLKDKAYRIPKALIEDLYNPHVGIEYYRDALRIVRDDKTIIINMSGGDAVAAYDVKFTINLTKMTIRRELFRIFNVDIPIIKEGKLEN